MPRPRCSGRTNTLCRSAESRVIVPGLGIRGDECDPRHADDLRVLEASDETRVRVVVCLPPDSQVFRELLDGALVGSVLPVVEPQQLGQIREGVQPGPVDAHEGSLARSGEVLANRTGVR